MIYFKETASDQDLLHIEEMASVIWHEHYTPIIGAKQVAYMLDKFQSVPSMTDQIENGYHYFLIEQDDSRVGYLSFVKREDALFLSKIYVLKEFRGHGIGGKAFRFIEDQAKKRFCKRISLTVNRNNINSIKAYEKSGFNNTGAVVQDIGNGYVMDDYIMEKCL